MVEPEKPLEKKDKIAIDEDVARNLEAQLQAELEEEERLSRQKEEEANIALLESWDNTQAMMDKRKKHFAALRAQEKRSKPPNKAQKRNTMSTYLKNMAGYKHNQQKSKSSSKRAGDELEQEKAKKQKGDDDQEKAEMKSHIEIVKDNEVAIDAIPLATKPPVIVDYKIDKDGRMGYFKLIRADGSSKRYSSMIKMLQGIDREDLETLWKLVKAKHENTRPEDDYERVLWGDLKDVISIVGIKSLLQVTAAKYKVNVAEGVNAASEEVSTAELVSTAYESELVRSFDIEDLCEYTDLLLLEDMDSESAHMVAASNVPILKPETLDQTFDRLQKLMSQLEILGETLSQESGKPEAV
ncbi:hypothetical protein Tco_0695061 [Tanacetum coccineum]